MHAWALPLPSASTNLLPALFVERLESQERPPAPQRASIVRTVHHSSTNTSNQSGLRGPAYRRIKVAVKLTAVEIDDLDRDGRRVGHRACTQPRPDGDTSDPYGGDIHRLSPQVRGASAGGASLAPRARAPGPMRRVGNRLAARVIRRIQGGADPAGPP